MKKKKIIGRPKKLKKDLKKSCSVRLTILEKVKLVKKYGSIQKAIDCIIENDDAWT